MPDSREEVRTKGPIGPSAFAQLSQNLREGLRDDIFRLVGSCEVARTAKGDPVVAREKHRVSALTTNSGQGEKLGVLKRCQEVVVGTQAAGKFVHGALLLTAVS